MLWRCLYLYLYRDHYRERLITVIKSGSNRNVSAVLYDMFKLNVEQKQICAQGWEGKADLSFEYSTTAPQMPEGTNPADDCFLQLSPKEQSYWRQQYQERDKCGTWIMVGGK